MWADVGCGMWKTSSLLLLLLLLLLIDVVFDSCLILVCTRKPSSK